MRHRLFKRIVTGGVLALLAAVAMWWPTGAQAVPVPITFEFTGTVTSVDSLLVGGQVAGNDTLTGSYTFESTTVGIGPCGGIASCNYNGAITGLNFTVGSYTNTGVTGSTINVDDNNGGIDLYQPVAGVTGPSINGIAPQTFSFSLADFSQIMLSDTFLPTTPPPLPSFLPSFSVFGIAYSSPNVGSGVISGPVTSLTLAPVPESPTAWLFGLGFGLLALWKVRERHMGQQA